MFDLARFAAACHVADAADFARKMEELRLFLVAANEKTNLTRILEPDDFALKHVADSLAIIRFFPELAEKSFRIADVGCGAGFPSLVLATAFPLLEICAIDSAGKKTAFVASAKEKFALSNLRVVKGRSVELNRRAEFRGAFDIVTARAVASSDELWSGTTHFLRPGGRYIFYKTPGQAESERETLAQTGLHWLVTGAFPLPESAGERLFVHTRIR